jgi:hypothetical protein
MAGLGRRVWAADEVLSADDLQDYIQDQVVFVYNDASSRSSGILSPTEGMVSYLKNTNLLYVFDGTSWVEVAPDVGTPGTYTKVTTDFKGRVTSGTTLAATDIPNLDAAKITTGGFDASRITSGTFPDARISIVSTSKLSGVIGNEINSVLPIATTSSINCNGTLAAGALTTPGGVSSGANGVTTSGNIVGAATYNQTNTGRAMFVASNGLYGIGSSSRRFKENIVDAEIDTDAVLNIQVRKFNYKKSFDEAMPESIGVIAEELEELGFSDFLFYNEDGSVDGVAYEKLALALIPVLKKQQAQIDSVVARLNKLEK